MRREQTWRTSPWSTAWKTSTVVPWVGILARPEVSNPQLERDRDAARLNARSHDPTLMVDMLDEIEREAEGRVVGKRTRSCEHSTSQRPSAPRGAVVKRPSALRARVTVDPAPVMRRAQERGHDDRHRV